MAVAWSWAFDTPFKWTKQIASHFGGTRQGLAISWPARIKDAGGIRSQFHHIIDIVPTILEAAGIKAPDMVDGIEQKPIEGVSMMYTFDKANADAPSTRTTQYFEMAGNRGIYHDGWYANTTPPVAAVGAERADAGRQRLQVGAVQPDRRTTRRPTISRRRCRTSSRKCRRCSRRRRRSTTCFRWTTRSSSAPSRRGRAPPRDKTVFTYSGEMSGIPTGNAPSILNRSFTITAEVDVPEGGGTE